MVCSYYNNTHVGQARHQFTAASGHGPHGGESEGEGGASGAMSVVAGSWIGWVG